MNETQPTVAYSMETIDPRFKTKTYWFEANVPGYECTDICFGLSGSGEWTHASTHFFDLEESTKNELLDFARNLMPIGAHKPAKNC